MKVLINEDRIKKRVNELACCIVNDIDEPITVVCNLKGAFVFTADLIRSMKRKLTVEFVSIKSYQGTKRVESKINIDKLDFHGKRVLIVDDIFDSGKTLELLYTKVGSLGAAELRTCVLLDKDVRKETNIRPDYVGFKIPNYFVIGYGLDIDGFYRELPYIGYIEKG